MTNILVNHKET